MASSRRTGENDTESIRAEIARLRRRIDRRINRLVDRTLAVRSWRRYVQEHPERSLLAAAGVGLVASGVVSRCAPASRWGEELFDAACSAAWQPLWQFVRTAAEQVSDCARPEATAEEGSASEQGAGHD
jgi:hypothetical protein